MSESIIKQLMAISKNSRDCRKFNQNYRNVKLSAMDRLFRKKLAGYDTDIIESLLVSRKILPGELMFCLENKHTVLLVFNKKRTVVLTRDKLEFLTEERAVKIAFEYVQQMCYEDIKHSGATNHSPKTLKELMNNYEKHGALSNIRYDEPKTRKERPNPKPYRMTY